MALEIAVIYGSVRTQRNGIRGARFVVKQLEKRGHSVRLIDAKDYDLPLLDKMYKQYDKGTAPADMERLAGELESADAYVVVTGEYNHGIPPALKNLLDHYRKEYFFKPAGIACYSAGIFGGVRAAVNIRPVLSELGMVTCSALFPMPQVQRNFDEEGNAQDEKYEEFVVRFLDELVWYGNALKKARAEGVPY